MTPKTIVLISLVAAVVFFVCAWDVVDIAQSREYYNQCDDDEDEFYQCDNYEYNIFLRTWLNTTLLDYPSVDGVEKTWRELGRFTRYTIRGLKICDFNLDPIPVIIANFLGVSIWLVLVGVLLPVTSGMDHLTLLPFLKFAIKYIILLLHIPVAVIFHAIVTCIRLGIAIENYVLLTAIFFLIYVGARFVWRRTISIDNQEKKKE